MKHNYYTLVFFSALLLSCTSFLNAQTSFGDARLINDGCLFQLKNEAGAIRPDFNDRSWRRLNLPHDWSIEGTLSPTLACCTGFLPSGIAWYRKKLDIPSDFNGKKVFVYFEGVYNRISVYINGQLLDPK
jgi:beta-galactosidase